MRKEINTLEEKKFQILLHSNECLNNRIISNIKLYYDVGIVITSSIVLLAIYSIVENKYPLLFVIPLLIALGEVFYLYLTYLVMKSEFYIIKNIECKFDILIESKILYFAREIGLFRHIYDSKLKDALSEFRRCKWIPFVSGYLFFCIIVLIINFNEFIWVIRFILIYYLVLLGLIVAILFIEDRFSYYSKEIVEDIEM